MVTSTFVEKTFAPMTQFIFEPRPESVYHCYKPSIAIPSLTRAFRRGGTQWFQKAKNKQNNNTNTHIHTTKIITMKCNRCNQNKIIDKKTNKLIQTYNVYQAIRRTEGIGTQQHTTLHRE